MVITYPVISINKSGVLYEFEVPDFPGVSDIDFNGSFPLAERLVHEEIKTYIARQIPVPVISSVDPKTINTEIVIQLSVLVTAKVLIHNEILTQEFKNINKVCNRLRMERSQVNKVLDLDSNTSFDIMEKAFRGLGLQMSINLIPIE